MPHREGSGLECFYCPTSFAAGFDQLIVAAVAADVTIIDDAYIIALNDQCQIYFSCHFLYAHSESLFVRFFIDCIFYSFVCHNYLSILEHVFYSFVKLIIHI